MAKAASVSFARPGPGIVVVLAYALVAVVSWAVARLSGHDAFSCPSALGPDAAASGAAGVLLSLGLGVSLGALTIGLTRTMVRRVAWARELHAGLRPTVRDAPDATLSAVALASGVGEELLFRGLLVPVLGVVVSSIVFGALHQIRGRARAGWMAWATATGMLFALVFVATGSLAGPIVAHVAINHANLRFLRDNDPAPPAPRALGGLLRRPARPGAIR